MPNRYSDAFRARCTPPQWMIVFDGTPSQRTVDRGDLGE